VIADDWADQENLSDQQILAEWQQKQQERQARSAISAEVPEVAEVPKVKFAWGENKSQSEGDVEKTASAAEETAGETAASTAAETSSSADDNTSSSVTKVSATEKSQQKQEIEKVIAEKETQFTRAEEHGLDQWVKKERNMALQKDVEKEDKELEEKKEKEEAEKKKALAEANDLENAIAKAKAVASKEMAINGDEKKEVR
jgi:hypothetical protein